MNNVRDQTIILKDIQELCETTGYIHVLSHFAISSFFMIPDKKNIDSEVISSQTNKLERLVKNEFNLLLGFTIRKRIDFSPISVCVFNQSIQKTLNLLEELHECLKQRR